MNTPNYPPRLAVVAAMIDGQGLGRGPVVTAARLGSEIKKKAQSAAATTATPAERALAQALRGDGKRDEPSADQAIAELLLLVDDGPEARKLATGLTQAFLPPDDSNVALARDECRSAFADLYRSLVLHHLNSQVRNKAAALMCGLIRRRPARADQAAADQAAADWAAAARRTSGGPVPTSVAWPVAIPPSD